MQKVLQNFTCRLLMAPNTEQLNTVTHSRINEAGASNAGQPCKTIKPIKMPFGMWSGLHIVDFGGPKEALY